MSSKLTDAEIKSAKLLVAMLAATGEPKYAEIVHRILAERAELLEDAERWRAVKRGFVETATLGDSICFPEVSMHLFTEFNDRQTAAETFQAALGKFGSEKVKSPGEAFDALADQCRTLLSERKES